MNDPKVTTLEQCRVKLETLFEEHFKPDRDFMEQLEQKKKRHCEQYFEKIAQEYKERQQADDQDLRPMDLEADRAGLAREEGKHHEEDKSNDYVSYLDRCKKVGRVGPK